MLIMISRLCQNIFNLTVNRLKGSQRGVNSPSRELLICLIKSAEQDASFTTLITV